MSIWVKRRFYSSLVFFGAIATVGEFNLWSTEKPCLSLDQSLPVPVIISRAKKIPITGVRNLCFHRAESCQAMLHRPAVKPCLSEGAGKKWSSKECVPEANLQNSWLRDMGTGWDTHAWSHVSMVNFLLGLKLATLALELIVIIVKGSEDVVFFLPLRDRLTAAINKKGRLEFRCIPGGQSALIAIHDFIPALPWFIYALVQAPFMRG